MRSSFAFKYGADNSLSENLRRGHCFIGNVYSVVLILLCELLESASNSSVRIECLTNYTLGGKRASNLLANATNVAILGELAADSAVLTEDGCALTSLFFTCRRLRKM